VVVAIGSSQGDLQAAALADPKVKAHLEGKQVVKVVVVPGKLVNVVVR
jgi:leucyl-tRNA synthetase